MNVNNTATFREAIRTHCTRDAETFLNRVRTNPAYFPKYDARWLDHRERELFWAFFGQSDWAGAKRVVEVTADPGAKQDRRRRLEELSGKQYDQI